MTFSTRRSFVQALLGLVVPPFERERQRAPMRVAVIVHPQNPLQSVSSSELERIFRLRQQRWSNGERIYLLMREEGNLAKEIVLEKVYRMTSDELKRFWLAKIYRGEMTSFPKTFRSDGSVLRFVSQVPNAIGFVDAANVSSNVRVLRIDGRFPDAEDYLLVESGG